MSRDRALRRAASLLRGSVLTPEGRRIRSASRSLGPLPTQGLLALAAAVTALPAAAAAQEVELRPRYVAGEEYVYNSTFNSTVAGGAFNQTQTMTSVIRHRVVSVAEDGSAVVRMTTESLTMFIDGPLGRMEYDSKSGVAPTGPFAGIASALPGRVGESRDVTFSKNGALLSMEGAAGLRTPDDLMAFPESAVAPGAEWSRESSADLPTGTGVSGSMKASSRYRLREVTSQEGSRIATIEVATSGSMEQDPTSAGAELIGSVPIESTGEIHFDVDKGLLVRSHQRQVMTMSVMGENMQATSEMTMALVP